MRRTFELKEFTFYLFYDNSRTINPIKEIRSLDFGGPQGLYDRKWAYRGRLFETSTVENTNRFHSFYRNLIQRRQIVKFTSAQSTRNVVSAEPALCYVNDTRVQGSRMKLHFFNLFRESWNLQGKKAEIEKREKNLWEKKRNMGLLLFHRHKALGTTRIICLKFNTPIARGKNLWESVKKSKGEENL